MGLSQAKTYGGIGALLGIIGGIIPHIGSVLSIVGLVLIILAVKYISDETNDESIFKNYLIAFVMQILGMVVLMVVIGGSVVGAMTMGARGFTTMMESILLGIFLLWIFLLAGSFFIRKSYISIAGYTDVNMFSTVGTLYLIGAALLIVMIGALILIVAKVLEIIAFFSLPETLPTKSQTAGEFMA